MNHPRTQDLGEVNRELKQRQLNGDVNKDGKKAIGLDWQNNNSARAHGFSYTSLNCRRCTFYDVKLHSSRFMEDGSTRYRYNLLEFNYRKNRQPVTN